MKPQTCLPKASIGEFQELDFNSLGSSYTFNMGSAIDPSQIGDMMNAMNTGYMQLFQQMQDQMRSLYDALNSVNDTIMSSLQRIGDYILNPDNVWIPTITVGTPAGMIIYDFGSVSTDQTIAFGTYTYAKLTLAGNIQITLSDLGIYANIVYLELTQDATGSRVPTWAGNIHFPGSVEPTLSSGASDKDLLIFVWNGSVYQLVNAIFDLQT